MKFTKTLALRVGIVAAAMLAGFAALAIRRKGPDADVPVPVSAPA